MEFKQITIMLILFVYRKYSFLLENEKKTKHTHTTFETHFQNDIFLHSIILTFRDFNRIIPLNEKKTI